MACKFTRSRSFGFLSVGPLNTMFYAVDIHGGETLWTCHKRLRSCSALCRSGGYFIAHRKKGVSLDPYFDSFRFCFEVWDLPSKFVKVFLKYRGYCEFETIFYLVGYITIFNVPENFVKDHNIS